ncbi:hypothetical protein M3Y97_00980700 [Aphelenchoides bicaudatus]|nr:hypothetical protein M3Y97_00980700 [Aphelenchoides bicaudatus]
MSIAVLLKASPSQNAILSNFLLVKLGDISYSVYLIHWPISQWNAYWHLADYLWTGGLPQVEATVILITLSILIGWIFEEGYVKISQYLTTWIRLTFVVFCLYWFIGEGMLYLKLNEGDVNLKTLLLHSPTPLKNNQPLLDDLNKMWSDEFPRKLNKSLAIYYNQHFYGFAWDLKSCPDPRRKSIPTNFDLRNRVGYGNTKDRVVGITGSCVVKGDGNKNIVLFGNSHAQTAFFGIEREFRGVYRHLTLFSAGACILIKWRGTVMTPTKATYNGCIRVIDNLYEILREWKHPIDVIMMVHAYLYPPEMIYFPVDNLENDPEYLQLNQLFQKLSSIARDVVFVPQLHFETGIVAHMNVLYRQILNNEHLGMFSSKYENQLRRAHPIRRRIEKAASNCSKCILLEWEDIWCDKRDGLCRSVNTYGSLFVGRYIRQRYDEWMARNQSLLV